MYEENKHTEPYLCKLMLELCEEIRKRWLPITICYGQRIDVNLQNKDDGMNEVHNNDSL